MIYAVTWREVGNIVNLAKAIKFSHNDDKFIFIITDGSMPLFKNWIKDNNLKVFFTTPQPITNIVHPGYGRWLHIIVLSGGTNEAT